MNKFSHIFIETIDSLYNKYLITSYYQLNEFINEYKNFNLIINELYLNKIINYNDEFFKLFNIKKIIINDLILFDDFIILLMILNDKNYLIEINLIDVVNIKDYLLFYKIMLFQYNFYFKIKKYNNLKPNLLLFNKRNLNCSQISNNLFKFNDSFDLFFNFI